MKTCQLEYCWYVILWGFFVFCFWLHRSACGILLLPCPGIEPRVTAVKALIPNH